ncbi:hypothetical protein ZHAS_00001712 [Anopheles sinensis]|uniref:Uncharacterized protein n=1 Tax=Anopheles sinensis TaxID=74873 RepID=A0A084VBJ1_ANOSI|nr:hypothetical protein ZHAS_00001712 [Anopheles sinensis]
MERVRQHLRHPIPHVAGHCDARGLRKQTTPDAIACWSGAARCGAELEPEV